MLSGDKSIWVDVGKIKPFYRLNALENGNMFSAKQKIEAL